MASEQQEECVNELNTTKSNEESDCPPLLEPELSISNTSTLKEEGGMETVEQTQISTPIAMPAPEEKTCYCKVTNLKAIEDHCSTVNRIVSGSNFEGNENDLSTNTCQFSPSASTNAQSNSIVNGSEKQCEHQGMCCAEFYAQLLAMQSGMQSGTGMGMQMTPEMQMQMQMNPGMFMPNYSYPLPQNYVDPAAYQSSGYANYSQMQPQSMSHYNNYGQGQVAAAAECCNRQQSSSNSYYSESHSRVPNAVAGAALASSNDFCDCNNSHSCASAATASGAQDNGCQIEDLGSDNSCTGPIQDECRASASVAAKASAFEMPDSTEFRQSVHRPSCSSLPFNMNGCGCPMSCSPSSPDCCMPMNCCSYPLPSCQPMPCGPAYPNCLDVDSFVRRAQTTQPQCFPTSYCTNYCAPAAADCCCENDRIQSQTVYSTDYKPYCGTGNNFNHFPNRKDCNCNDNCCMPQMCCPCDMPCQSNACCGLPNPCSAPCIVPCPALFPAYCQTNCFDTQQ